MNLVVIQGRPTKDIYLREASKNKSKKYVKFILAVKTPHRRDKQTTFIPVICFDSLAVRMSMYLKKGAFCTVIGKLQNDEKVNELGQLEDHILIYATSIEIHQRVGGSDELRSLASGYRDEDIILPNNVDDALFRQIDAGDEDLPDFAVKRGAANDLF